MKTTIENRSGHIYIANVNMQPDIDLVQGNLVSLADMGLVTFGNNNIQVMQPVLEKRDLFKIEENELCFDDDKSIGLEMPNTWYLNRGTNALSISMYYNFLGFKEMVKDNVLFKKNASAFNHFGRIGVIEVYLQKPLEQFLKVNKMPYFGTPKTLTECMRVLEGWSIERVGRLRSYRTYASFIQEWCRANYPDYNESEWSLGEVRSAELFAQKQTTNVRKAIMFFWKNYLLNKSREVTPGDIEIDVLSPDFYHKRKPDFVLVGNDIFTQEQTNSFIQFKSYSSDQTFFANRELEHNGKDLVTAEMLEQQFPDSKIIVFRNPNGLPNFSMCKLDEIKQGINREVAQIAEVLVSFINKN